VNNLFIIKMVEQLVVSKLKQ